MSAETSPAGEADGSSDAENKEFSCPSCDRIFDTKNGRSVHHYQSHGESIAKTTKECTWCGVEFEYYKHDSEKKYCSDKCRADYVSSCLSGKQNHNYVQRVEIECEYCKDGFEVKKTKTDKRKFCSRDCRYSYMDEYQHRENHPRWVENTITFECDYCGSEYEKHKSRQGKTRFCSRECHANAQAIERCKEDSPTWKGGYGHYYGPNWPEQQRKALKRDQYRCQRCLKSENRLPRKPDVHHLKRIGWFKENLIAPKWYKEGNKLDNLVCFCRSCHGKWEGIPLRPQ